MRYFIEPQFRNYEAIWMNSKSVSNLYPELLDSIRFLKWHFVLLLALLTIERNKYKLNTNAVLILGYLQANRVVWIGFDRKVFAFWAFNSWHKHTVK